MRGLLRFGLGASCVPSCLVSKKSAIFFGTWHLGSLGCWAQLGTLFQNARLRSLLGGAEARQTARALADPPHARRTAEMSSPASRPDRPEGAAETRRGDDASEGHAARSASSEGSNVAEGSSSAREGLPSAGTSTTGQDATGAEARDESPDVSSRVTSGAGKDAADAPHAPHAPSTVRPARPPQRPPSELRPRRGAASAPDARLAPPRASRGVAGVIEWRAKISQAARDVQTAVEDASGLRVDDSAADLESLVEEERKMVRDLPRNAGAALSDARRVAGTVAGATWRTVDEVVGTAVGAARAGNRAERGSRGEDPSDRGAIERRDDAARLRRKAERRAALAKATSDASTRVSVFFRNGSERAAEVRADVASTVSRAKKKTVSAEPPAAPRREKAPSPSP